jgi:hypothetical protein
LGGLDLTTSTHVCWLVVFTVRARLGRASSTISGETFTRFSANLGLSESTSNKAGSQTVGYGQYMKLLKNNQSFWLWDKAEEDVYMLRGCHSQPMFDKLKDTILASWTHDEEQDLADTF